MIDRILNALIFAVTAVIMIRLMRKGKQEFLGALRFFTVLSNLLCAISALLMSLMPGNTAVWMLKYLGTVTVTVTMLTVFLFLAPSFGSLRPLLEGDNLFLHLLTPLAALISFCVFERRGMSFGTAMWGLLPVLLYGMVYLQRIQSGRWEDFYGFNKNGKWPVSFAAMAAGTFLVCAGLAAVQNIA